MQFEIRNRFSGAVQFTAEIDCAADAPMSVKIGFAVKWAMAANAYLCGANLCGANLRGANLREADLCRANLRGADLCGANLREADLCGADLCGANLRGADLCRANLREANLRGANLREADLREANLRGANLREADLCEADLRRANLREAPAIENIHAKVYAAASQPGALDMSMWHCGTSHCRAGWVVTLAGKEGADLESEIGTPAAAMAIYMASDPERWKTERLPDFYCGNATALADMARMAGVDGVADLTDTAGR
jgi:hypothetical protein